MRTRSRALAVAATVASLVCSLAACSERGPSGRVADDHACVQPTGEAGPPEPTVAAVVADRHTGEPGALGTRVDLGTLARHARSGPLRADAEQFALLFAQAVLDSREEVDAQRLVDGFAAAELPPKACRYVLARLPQMRALGWGMYIDPTTTAWVRSRAEGDAASPTRVEVELVLTVDLENDPGLFDVEGEPLVTHSRVEVVRDGDVWLVADWEGPAAAGLEPGRRPTKQFYGVGWRSWVPGVRPGD